MSVPVLFAAVLQLLLAATFVALPVAVARSGAAAQDAAEAEVARQRGPADTLAALGIRLTERPAEFLLAIAVAAILTTLGSLNLAGTDAGRLLSWIIEPLVLIAVGLVTAGQVFATRYTQAAFARSPDPAIRALDATAVMRAAMGAMPSWVRPVVVFRFALVIAGSPAILVLLAIA
jgi:hypothetical protein